MNKDIQLVSKEELKSVVEISTDLTVITDSEGVIVYVSPQCKDVIGYDEHCIIGKKEPEFIHPDDKVKCRDVWDRVIAGESIQQFKYRIFDNKNTIRWLSHSAKYIVSSDTVINIIQNITEQKQIEENLKKSTNAAEKELSQSHKMRVIGQFAGGIAHDFNNVLSSIIGYADMALDELPSDDLLSRYMRKILIAGERARHLVSQILTFSRKGKEEKLPVNLRPVMIEVIELVNVSLPSSIQLSVDVKKDTCPVIADTTKVHEAVMNLTTNAMRAMDEKGKLTISLFEEKTEVPQQGIISTIEPGFYSVIEVKDTGTGIEPALINYIFEPFFTTNESEERTGLGLSVVYGVMQSHNGNIQVESKNGEGTLFRLFFPKFENIGTAFEKETRPQPVKGHERILYVDDEELVKNMGTILLDSLGYKVTSTTDSMEALEIFKKNPDSFDLLITDQTMPKMTGLELSKEVLKINPQTPIILFTGYSSQVSDEKIAELGIKALCYKPLTKRNIADKLREILEMEYL